MSDTASNSKFDVFFFFLRILQVFKSVCHNIEQGKVRILETISHGFFTLFTKYLAAGSDSYKMYAIYDFVCCMLWEL